MVADGSGGSGATDEHAPVSDTQDDGGSAVLVRSNGGAVDETLAPKTDSDAVVPKPEIWV